MENLENLDLENLEIDSEKEFQNLLAIRGQLVALLIATSGGTVWLAYNGRSILTAVLVFIGVIFITSIIKNLKEVEKDINKNIRRHK